MNQPTLNFTFPVYTVNQLLEIIQRELVIDTQSLIEYGFAKWDKDDPRPFIKSINLGGTSSLHSQYLLDTGDREWIWLVNMSEAILIKKN
jgi:hypothetical protein